MHLDFVGCITGLNSYYWRFSIDVLSSFWCPVNKGRVPMIYAWNCVQCDPAVSPRGTYTIRERSLLRAIPIVGKMFKVYIRISLVHCRSRMAELDDWKRKQRATAFPSIISDRHIQAQMPSTSPRIISHGNRV